MTRRRKMQWTRVRPLGRHLLLRGDIPDPKRSHYRGSTPVSHLMRAYGHGGAQREDGRVVVWVQQ